jgi:hypothetical protein
MVAESQRIDWSMRDEWPNDALDTSTDKRRVGCVPKRRLKLGSPKETFAARIEVAAPRTRAVAVLPHGHQLQSEEQNNSWDDRLRSASRGPGR